MTFRSLLRGALVAATLLSAPTAFAQSLVGGTVLNGGVPSYNVNATAPFTIDQGTLALRVFVVNGSGGGGTGTSGPYYTAQYNSTLPTFTSAQVGYLSVDANGRLILAPSTSISVSNFPTSQTVTNAGTFAVQNTAAIVGGNTTAVKTDGSAVTQPVSAASLPLPAGAATSANQSSEISALGTTGDSAYAGSGTASIIAALKGVYNATLAPLAAGSNVIGSTTMRSAGTSRSASVTTTAANLMASNTSRQGWKIKNDCTVAVWINFDGTAATTAGSGNMQIPAGGYMSSEPGFVETGAMSAIAASGTCALTAREY